MRIDPSKLSRPISMVYRLWCRSLRFQDVGQEHLDCAAAQGRRLIYAIWHDELFPLVWYATRKNLKVGAMVSQSRDGELLAGIIESLGIPTIRGSSSRGGVKALVSAIRLIERQGHDIVITVDGPRGPRHIVKEGAIHLASRTGAHIMPVRVSMKRTHIFHKAWDKFQLPWPLTRCRVVFGEPYAVSRSLDEAGIAQERSQLEKRLEALDAELSGLTQSQEPSC
ncbi:lysophospholipid acyltransferase family protein [Desulfocurvibacter africanus]|uniref:lysophospholipid acyltransferase family protein n=1 Tax=Desulfocurvibacter africanus TaxID=873 RepID=UPI002FDA3B48